MASTPLLTTYRTVVAKTIAMAYHTHVAHWNVMGRDFPELHALFDTIYSEVDGSVDALAEDLRTLKELAPASLVSIAKIAGEGTPKETNDPAALVASVAAENDTLIVACKAAYEAAEAAKEYGLSGRMQERLLAHAKHAWMLRATKVGG